MLRGRSSRPDAQPDGGRCRRAAHGRFSRAANTIRVITLSRHVRVAVKRAGRAQHEQRDAEAIFFEAPDGGSDNVTI